VNINKSKIFVFFLTVMILSACTTTPVISAADDFPLIFSAVENISPRWRHYAAGVDFLHGRIESPRLEFWALKIDLNAENVAVVVRAGAANSGSGGAFSTKVSSFVRDNNLIAGINATPFDVNTTKEGESIRNLGVIISGGVLLSNIIPQYDALVIYNSFSQSENENEPPIMIKRAAIVRQSSIQMADNIENAIGGFFQILTGGVPAQRTMSNDARHPRSAAGVSDNGEYLYLLAIDGRRAGSVGSTERETAVLLQRLGCRDGINFDGGGSTALAMRNSGGNVRTVNTPVHQFFPGQERAVAGCIGIKAE